MYLFPSNQEKQSLFKRAEENPQLMEDARGQHAPMSNVQHLSREQRLYDAYDAANDYSLAQRSMVDPEVQRESNKAEGKHTLFGTGIGTGVGGLSGGLLAGKGMRLPAAGIGALSGALAGGIGGAISGSAKADSILQEKQPNIHAEIEKADNYKKKADEALRSHFEREEERAKRMEKIRANEQEKAQARHQE